MAISKLQNGTAKGSFLSGFAASLLGGTIAENFGNSHTIVKVTMAAIAGGTASVIGGGKFSNGAMGAAFIMLFNELANTYPSREKMLNIAQSKWKMGDKGMYKTLMVNGTDTGQVSAFNAYGPSAGDKFFSGLGNGVVNGVHFVGDHGDGIGLMLSVGAMATPGGWGYAMGVAAIGIDISQADNIGTIIGVAALVTENSIIDIGYGLYQVF